MSLGLAQNEACQRLAQNEAKTKECMTPQIHPRCSGANAVVSGHREMSAEILMSTIKWNVNMGI